MSLFTDPETQSQFKTVFGGVCRDGYAKPIHEQGINHKGDQYEVGGIVAFDTIGKHAPLILQASGVAAQMDKRTGHVAFNQGGPENLVALQQKLGL